MIVASGHVGERPFARTVYAIAARRLTGDLVLVEAGKRYVVAWEGGQVVGAESAAATDSAGRIALAAGLVSTTVVAQSLDRMKASPSLDQIEVLAEVGRLAPEHVATLRRRVLAHRAARIFALADARFELDDQRALRAEPVPPLDARWLIYYGLRTHYDEARLDRELLSLSGKAAALAPDAFGAIAHFGFGEVERPVLEILRDRMLAIPELVAALPGQERRTVLAVLYALGACDCLTVGPAAVGGRPASSSAPPATPEAIPHPEPTRPTGPIGVGTTGPHRPITAAALGAQNRIRRLTGQPPLSPDGTDSPLRAPSRPPGTIDPTGSGGIAAPSRPPGAPLSAATLQPTAPIRAPGRASTSSAPPGDPLSAATLQPTAPIRAPSRPPGAPLSAATIQPTAPIRTPGRAGTSSAPPGDPAAAEARALIREKLRELEAGASHFALLGISGSASAAEVRTAYFGLAKRLHPDRLSAVGVVDVAADAQRLFAAINQAFAVLSDTLKRNQYSTLLAAGGESAVRKQEAEAEALASKIFQAEDAFQKGEMALRRSQFEQARGFYQLAVQLSPDEPEHQAMLAWTTWVTTDNKQSVYAEVQRQLNQALQTSAKCIPALFYKGVIAKQAGKVDVAVESFRRVLELRPSHAEAELELRLLQSRHGKKKDTSTGGLFDKLKRK